MDLNALNCILHAKSLTEIIKEYYPFLKDRLAK